MNTPINLHLTNVYLNQINLIFGDESDLKTHFLLNMLLELPVSHPTPSACDPVPVTVVVHACKVGSVCAYLNQTLTKKLQRFCEADRYFEQHGYRLSVVGVADSVVTAESLNATVQRNQGGFVLVDVLTEPYGYIQIKDTCTRYGVSLIGVMELPPSEDDFNETLDLVVEAHFVADGALTHVSVGNPTESNITQISVGHGDVIRTLPLLSITEGFWRDCPPGELTPIAQPFDIDALALEGLRRELTAEKPTFSITEFANTPTPE